LISTRAEAGDHREDADVELSDKARGGAAFCFTFGGRRAGAPRRGHYQRF